MLLTCIHSECKSNQNWGQADVVKKAVLGVREPMSPSTICRLYKWMKVPYAPNLSSFTYKQLDLT